MIKEQSELSKLIEKYYPGKKFYSNDLKQAGKHLKKSEHLTAKESEELTVEFLKSCKEKLYDFRPPAKALIISTSRPFEEWPIYKASESIQKYIYSLTKEELEKYNISTDKTSQENFFKESLIDNYGFANVSGLNLIFQHTKAIYDGVLKKVNNRNNKILKKYKRKIEEGIEIDSPELEKAIDESGHFINPPGINKNIYCYQQVSPTIFNSFKETKIICPFNYKRNPNDIIQKGVIDRLAIPFGEPGYIPDHQRDKVNKHKKRIRKYYKNNENKNKDAILAKINIGEDWVLFDLRGLLRNAYWRKLIPKQGITPQQLLDMFSGDPVIDPIKNNITFIYKESIIPIHSESIIKTKKSKELLEKLTKDEQIALVSIDLGQTNPVAARFSRLSSDLKPEHVSSSFLPDELKNEICRYREKSDLLEIEIKNKAIKMLSQEQQDEIKLVNDISSEELKNSVCKKYNIDNSKIPWDKMNGFTTFIADEFINNGGDKSLVYFTAKDKKSKKEKLVKLSDKKIANSFKPKISKETREILNKITWDEKISSNEYKKLSKRKLEFARRATNYLINQAKKATRLNNVVLVVEDLNSKFFHGSGKREDGWDNFFIPKKENRWFIQALHKSLTDVSIHRGINVIEVRPERTSITCPKCGCCDKENRKGEDFKCIKCDSVYHADLEVATFNIEKVAITGESMPKPDCERLGGEESIGIARKGKNKPKSISKSKSKSNSTKMNKEIDNLSQSAIYPTET